MSPRQGGPSDSPGRLETVSPPSVAVTSHTTPRPEPGRVLAFPRIDPRRAEELQLALDGVQLAIGYAAGTAQVLLEAYYPPRVARRRLEQLRREWHRVVDDTISRALAEGRAS